MSKKKKPNCVEFLTDYIKGISSLNSDEIIKMAEALHEEEHIQTYSDGISAGMGYERGDLPIQVLDEKRYYNKIFRGKIINYETIHRK